MQGYHHARYALVRARLRRTARLLRRALRGPAAGDQTGRNIHFLFTEVAWAGVLNAAVAFNSAFAVRLGATNEMIGWLSSLPALIAMLLLIPAARLLESKANRVPWVAGSLFVTRLGYLLLAVLPWILSAHRAEAAVAILIGLTIPSTLFSAGWNPLLADAVPEQDRTWVLARRNILYSGVTVVLTFAASRWLDASSRIPWAAFPLNYQIIYLVGFAGAVASTIYVSRIKVPANKVISAAHAGQTPRAWLAQVRAMFGEQKGFRAIVVNTLIFDCGAWLVGPLYILFFVRELGASDSWIGLNSTLANAGVIAGYMLWRRWVRKLGYSRTLLLDAPLAASYPFLVSLFPNLTAILVFGVLINIINPGINLSHFNMLLQLCPAERRATYIATFSTIENVGAFVMPMLGVALADLFGIRTVLLIGGAVRLLGALLFHANRIQVPQVEIR